MALGDLTIIGDVTRTLGDLLSELDVTFLSPAALDSASNESFKRVNLYLYQVQENPDTKNQRWITRADGKQQYPPLALNLHYLLTPYASDPLSAHDVLTSAVKALYEKSIIRGADLRDSLRLSVEQLAVVLCPLGLEDLTRIWNALQKPYRLSVAYEVRIVLVESDLQVTPARVMKKKNAYQQI